MFPQDSKILIIDDSSFSRNMLIKTLGEMKYWKILEAADAIEAQRLMLAREQQTDPVHLLIVDLHMPDVGGLDFLRWVRLQKRISKIPTIIMTSSQEKREVLEAAAIGVSQYVIKPYDMKTLTDKMAATWTKHGQAYYSEMKAAKPTA